MCLISVYVFYIDRLTIHVLFMPKLLLCFVDIHFREREKYSPYNEEEKVLQEIDVKLLMLFRVYRTHNKDKKKMNFISSSSKIYTKQKIRKHKRDKILWSIHKVTACSIHYYLRLTELVYFCQWLQKYRQ